MKEGEREGEVRCCLPMFMYLASYSSKPASRIYLSEVPQLGILLKPTSKNRIIETNNNYKHVQLHVH